MSYTKESFFSPWQAADYAGLKLEALQAMIASGEIQAEEFNGTLKIRQSTLDQWLDAEVPQEELDRLKEQMKEPSDLLDSKNKTEE